MNDREESGDGDSIVFVNPARRPWKGLRRLGRLCIVTAGLLVALAVLSLTFTLYLFIRMITLGWAGPPLEANLLSVIGVVFAIVGAFVLLNLGRGILRTTTRLTLSGDELAIETVNATKTMAWSNVRKVERRKLGALEHLVQTSVQKMYAKEQVNGEMLILRDSRGRHLAAIAGAFPDLETIEREIARRIEQSSDGPTSEI